MELESGGRKCPLSSDLRENHMQAAPSSHRRPTFARRIRNVGSGLAGILALAGDNRLIGLAGGFPDPQTFPVDVLPELVAQVIENDSEIALQYSPTPGLPGLRDAIRTRHITTDGTAPAEQELMVTSGNIEALDLIAKTLIDPGDVVVVEGPTYLGAIDVFRGFEADIRSIPVDGDGIETSVLDRVCRSGAPPKLLYTIPEHQNPTGIRMSLERRTELLRVCRNFGLYIIEDVAYRDLSFDGRRFPSLWSLAPDLVIQVGTTSKTFFPGVRLGWAVGPKTVLERMLIAKQCSDQCAGAFGQRLFEEYLRGGHMARQLTKSNALYSRRCQTMLAALDEYMPTDVTWTRPAGGFFVWIAVPKNLDANSLSLQSREAGVAIMPGAPFFAQTGGNNNVRLAFSHAPDHQIDEGIRLLAQTIRTSLEIPT